MVNLHAQRYPGRPKYDNDSKQLREKWFADGLSELSQHNAFAQPHQSVAFPIEIGCGLAGGDWESYRKMIQVFAESNPEVEVAIVRLSRGSGTARPTKKPRR